MITMVMILMMGLFQSENSTEIQKYEVIRSDNDFEIRYYPPAILASVEMGGTYDQSRNGSFGVLAGYIFGGNEEGMQISMTAPVRMSETDGMMSFVMPSHFQMGDLPKPNNKQVAIHSSEPAYIASIRFGGWANDKKIAEHKQKLVKWLDDNKLKHNGKFEYLGYDAPFRMTNRRNEVVVSLEGYQPD
jgi:hypothetical protein